MNGKPKHVKVYDLERNLIEEFSMYKEAAKYLMVSEGAVKNAAQRGSCLGTKYYIRSEGPKTIDNSLKGNLFCKCCGIKICEKNRYTQVTNSKVYIANKCKSCQRKANFCDLHYESEKLEVLSKKRSAQLSRYKWKLNNKEKVKQFKDQEKELQKEKIRSLDGNYVKRLLSNLSNHGITMDNVPEKLIEMKKKELLVRRALKKQGIWVR
jgi:hypothetical protein